MLLTTQSYGVLVLSNTHSACASDGCWKAAVNHTLAACEVTYCWSAGRKWEPPPTDHPPRNIKWQGGRWVGEGRTVVGKGKPGWGRNRTGGLWEVKGRLWCVLDPIPFSSSLPICSQTCICKITSSCSRRPTVRWEAYGGYEDQPPFFSKASQSTSPLDTAHAF